MWRRIESRNKRSCCKWRLLQTAAQASPLPLCACPAVSAAMRLNNPSGMPDANMHTPDTESVQREVQQCSTLLDQDATSILHGWLVG